ncbi:MAG: M14 family zinc carboxypeptidase [Armatimonadota bacterium]|nr:succinylglutamate desuccinylase/aspartoacylase family protein [bacterium]
MRQVRTLSESPHVRLLPFGNSYSGRPIAAFVMSDFSVDSRGKTRVMICAGQHGDEYDAVRSILDYCLNLANEPHPAILSKCIFIVIPMVNPDGIAASKRTNAIGKDINRDWTAFTTGEARYVHRIVRMWRPQLLIDQHQWNEPSSTPGNSIEVAGCETDTRRLAMTDLAIDVERLGKLSVVRCHRYSSESLFHRHYSAIGYAAYLVETAQGESYAARNDIYESTITTLVEAVCMNKSLCNVLSPASASFDDSSVGAYTIRTPEDGSSATSTLYGAIMLVIGCIAMVWLMRPFARSGGESWSHRFTRCAVAPGVCVDPLSLKRLPQPITSRSWVNKRLRTRYVAASNSKTDHATEDHNDSPLHIPWS